MKRKIYLIAVVLLVWASSTFAMANNDCASPQYGQGKAPVESNCVVSETGFSLFGITWWANFYDGVAMCCASVMDCDKSCDADNQTVCHRV